MYKPKLRINLSLPTSFNRCSVKQLRCIAAVMIDMVERSSSLQPFNMEEFKTAIFFCLANLEITEPVNPRVAVEDQYYMVRFKQNRLMGLWNRISGKNKEFALYLWQVASWICRDKDKHTGKEKRGLLDWLDADSKDFFVIFPFEFITRKKGLLGFNKVFKGPNPMLDGFSWQRYRFAQDFMENYTQQNNMLVRVKKMGRKASANDIVKAVHNIDLARALFLANLFETKIRFTDETTGIIRTDFHYQSNQASDNAEFFRNFSDVDWQIILFWWHGIMSWLGKTYPRVFKKQRVDNAAPVSPLELYSRTTATMEKYVGLSAEEVEREPYTNILQQMEDIARQNEEIDKMNKKNKH